MSKDTFAKCIHKVPKEVDIVFAGMAEPWMNVQASNMLLLADGLTHRISVYTTCFGMTLQDIYRIKNVPFNHFCIHLPDADGIMKIDITNEYLEVLKACMKIPSHNKIVIGKLHPKVEAITGPVHDGSASLISRAGNLKALGIPKKKGHLMCSATGPKIDHNVLLPNGDVLLCCMDYAQQHVIGNLLTDSYEDLFTSENYLKVMEGLKDDNSNILCRTCEISQVL